MLNTNKEDGGRAMSKKHEKQRQKRQQQKELQEKMARFDRGLTVGIAIAAGAALAFLIFLMIRSIISG